MTFAIVNKAGKVKKSFKDFAKAAEYFAKVDSKDLTLTRVENVKNGIATVQATPHVVTLPKAEEVTPVKAIRNAGIVRHYRASTLDRISAILKRGKENPRYALWARDEQGTVYLVCTTRTEKGAKYIRRKARGFTRRVLLRKLYFRVASIRKDTIKVAA